MYALRGKKLQAALLDGLYDAVLLAVTPAERFAPRILHLNPAFESRYGVSCERLRRRPLGALPYSTPTSRRMRLLRQAWRDGGTAETRETRRPKGQPPLTLACRAYPLDDSGPMRRLILIEHDISAPARERQRGDDLQAVVRLLQDALGRGWTLRRLRQQVAATVRTVTGADACLIQERQGRELVVTAASGLPAHYVGSRIQLEGSLGGECCRRGTGINCGDVGEEPRLSLARSLGLRAAVLVPLRGGGHCVGVLQILSARPWGFGPREQNLLEMAAAVLVHAFRHAARADTEAQRRRQLLDAVPILISYVDREGRYREANAAYFDWFPGEAADMRGRRVSEVLGAEAYARIRPYLEAALAGERVTFDALVPYKGQPRHVEADYVPHYDLAGNVAGFFALVRDVEDRRRADLDHLTGAYSRSRLDALWEEVHQEASRYGRPLSLIVIDLDHFKAINDRYGHPVGDAVLKDTASLVRAQLREADIFGRWGGEEFLLVAPESPLAATVRLAERLRALVASHRYAHGGAVSCSFGVAELRPGEGRASLFRRADEALYRAKREGRDQVAADRRMAERPAQTPEHPAPRAH